MAGALAPRHPPSATSVSAAAFAGLSCFSRASGIFLCFLLVLPFARTSTDRPVDELEPEFASPVQNATVPLGRDAQLNCVVENLGSYRAAWIKVETKAILTIHNRVISRNYRITLSHSDDRHFGLQIRSVQESDRGGYMCQINTVPMKSQVGFLDVLEPPDILVNESSSDVVTREGSNVTMSCKAKGYPSPNITWRREDNEPIPLGTYQGKKVLASTFENEIMSITRVSRLHMGAYLCIASNGVPPSVSRRIILHVQFPPVMWVPNQLVGAAVGQDVVLDCHSEAYPVAINYWSRSSGLSTSSSLSSSSYSAMATSEEAVIITNAKYETVVKEKGYKAHMKLTIRNLRKDDFGDYKCFAKNSLGTSEHNVRLYEIETISSTTTTTTMFPLMRTRGGKGGEIESSSYQRQQRFESPRESGKGKDEVSTSQQEEAPKPEKVELPGPMDSRPTPTVRKKTSMGTQDNQPSTSSRVSLTSWLLLCLLMSSTTQQLVT